MKKNESIIYSFKNAFAGFRSLFETERNAKVHLLFTFLVIFLSLYLRINKTEVILILIAVTLVWISELINTSLENLFNLIEPNVNPLVKKGKDIAAASVFLASLFSIVVGLLILGPPLFEMISLYF